MIVTFPFMGLVIWAYGRWRPGRDGRACAIYDTMAFTVYAIVLGTLPTLRASIGSPDHRSILGLAALFAPTLVLVVAGLVRNLLVFKSHANGAT
jgi:hypothetical protein